MQTKTKPHKALFLKVAKGCVKHGNIYIKTKNTSRKHITYTHMYSSKCRTSMKIKWISCRWLCWTVPEPCAPAKQRWLRNPLPSFCVQGNKMTLPLHTPRLRPIPRLSQDSSVYQPQVSFFFLQMFLILINVPSIPIACKNHLLNWPVSVLLLWEGDITSREGRKWDEEDA